MVSPTAIVDGNQYLKNLMSVYTQTNQGFCRFYITCFQINLTGSGTATPSGVSFAGAYSAQDPGILIDIYQTITNYVIPGPAVFTG
jgi:cellulase